MSAKESGKRLIICLRVRPAAPISGGISARGSTRSRVKLLLADGDVFSPSNLNRQFLATQATLGCNKAEVAAVDYILEFEGRWT